MKDAVGKESDIEIVIEEVPVGNRQANGTIENASKDAQG